MILLAIGTYCALVVMSKAREVGTHNVKCNGNSEGESQNHRWAYPLGGAGGARLAGLCYVLVGIFHPPNVAASVTTTRWEVVHVLACAMSFFGVLPDQPETVCWYRRRRPVGLGPGGFALLIFLAGAYNGL